MLEHLKKLKFDNSEKIQAFLKRNTSFTLTGLTSFLRLLVLAMTAGQKKVVFVTNTEQSCLKYKHDLEKFFDIEAKIFPYQDISTYEGVEPNLYKYAEQVELIRQYSVDIQTQKSDVTLTLIQGRKDYAIPKQVRNDVHLDVILIPIKALLEKFPDKDFYENNLIKISVDDEIDLTKLTKNLINLGYKRVTMVSDIGEFSVRGDIIDVFSFSQCPVRIELWGDTVTDIRYFNNETQRSIEKAKSVEILPAYKFILDENNIKTFKQELAQEIKNIENKDNADILRTKHDETVEMLDNEGYFDGIDYFQPYFNNDTKSFIDLIGKDFTVIMDESSEVFTRFEQIAQNYNKQIAENTDKVLNLPLKNKAHIEFEGFQNSIASMQKIFLDNFIDTVSDYTIEFTSSLIPSFSSKIEDIIVYIEENLKKKNTVVVATDYKTRLEEIFRNFEIPYSEKFEGHSSVYLTDNLALGGSYIEDFDLIVLTDKELFNKKSKDITAQKKSYFKEKAEYIESINDIKEGEFVVHHIHGVGMYKGLSKQEFDGQLKDYLTIEYAQGDKLHMPAEQINMLSRFRGAGATHPHLSRMGGNDWQNTKSRAKKAIEDIAKDLLRLYAKREVSEGITFEPDTVWQYEMEDAFEYTETPDQMKAIQDTKSDMEKQKPMDRLICADVGFGKTEVAIRAIFKAVMSGKQATVVVPTTILALQHFQTISERFKPFPVKVELLSRFRTAKEQKETLKNLINGECDVVIGTHRLLQNDIVFKDLGLLVIDEEHRFGVKHKEKLKMLRKDIDILSMSATPIPRTLYMSLSGIKDMSVMNTPPRNRLPIKTFVGVYNETYVKNAINHELERDGQVFFLYNRVETIYEFGSELQKIVPNAKIAVAHGQMDEKTLEKIMVEYAEHKYDVLLCTTIIESGLDIPNANTMIIYDSDKFGLAQLYQLRGRVGRSERQAYCYCFYRQKKELTPEATQRLSAIKEFSTLGGGYQIALRDIEIRGVGNILGTKQHGHMANIGFDTYCQLLEETINELNNTETEKPVQTIVDINVTAFIPDEWVGSKEQKMIEYKRLADVKTVQELELIHDEWKDRFSKIPESVENLIRLVHIRLLASQAKSALIRETPDNIRIYLPYTKAEWNIIASRLERNITKYIKYTIAPKSCQEGNSILLLDNAILNFDEVFNILSDLFYYINKISYEYYNNQ